MFSTQLRHTLVLSIALGSTFASFAHAKCCTSEVQTVWVHGRYSNAAPGDVVVNYVDGSSVIAPIIDAIGENYDHSMIVTDSASRVTHNLGDPATVETGWTCSHPLDPYQMRPMAPGAQSSVYPDDAGTFKAGAVLHGAGTPGCNVPGLAQGGVGYDLYGYSHSVRNGMCVQLLRRCATDAALLRRKHGGRRRIGRLQRRLLAGCRKSTVDSGRNRPLSRRQQVRRQPGGQYVPLWQSVGYPVRAVERASE